MTDLDFKKTVWIADPSKADKLRLILRDPVFSEAVEIALALNPPRIGGGPTGIQDTALDGARFAGMTQLLTALGEVARMEKREDTPPPKQKVPYAHVTTERSAFSPIKPPTKPSTKK